MKIFITGGAGFIGANIARHYLKQGIETVVYDNLSRLGVENNLSWMKKNYPNVIFLKEDVRNFPMLSRSMRGSDLVFHMASQVAVTSSVKNPLLDFEINALGTLNVLEAARAQKKPPIVVYASTNKVYGGMGNVDLIKKKTRYDFKNSHLRRGITEDVQIDFHSPYGCSKGAGDQYVHDYARIYGLRTLVFRQSCIYGDFQYGNEDQGWVAHFMRKLIKGETITIYGDGRQVRDLLYVRDLIDCYLRSVAKISKTSGRVYNIGGGRRFSTSLIELMPLIERECRTKAKVKYSQWRPGDQRVYISDCSKAHKDFGWEPVTSIDQGLVSLHQWMRAAHT
ncbi:MAG: CDP-paratose 2-epimerase [Candidatus Chisholmbacteria bacterium RIFCSPLOWO2_01_FULL_49_14]|uniref:CDP-paratose 2-epimerase n=1 Tax=Candidatus Chisholmbacteria bacterium RIFCSPLOWO2_01_FULL_49_14 TaxID=1797593 RepID=A0A1G1W3V6_9BACT|nr:MAG: CDP-paratose 2-epimerase [Candidatus Chisholmbacteria bacterium RIFCSPLOWO2_01_FULL_49_14]